MDLGGEAFALSEGLTNVKTQKNFARNLNSFFWYQVSGIKYQENKLWDLLKFRKKFKLLSPLSFLLKKDSDIPDYF